MASRPGDTAASESRGGGNGAGGDPAEDLQRARLGVIERMEARHEEFVAALFADLAARAPELVGGDPEALESLRNAGVAIADYGLESARDMVEGREVSWTRGEPTQAAENARLMARRGVPLELLLRAYRRAHAVYSDITSQEIMAIELDEPARAAALARASSFQFDYFDHLISTITEAYTSELRRQTGGREQRRAKAVSRLLDGEDVGSDELGYRLEGHHLALVVRGVGAESVARETASAFEHESLLVSHSDELAWLWLSSSQPFGEPAWERLRSHRLPDGVAIAAGESQSHREGFRLSHRQAQVAARASWASGRTLIRYSEVARLAAVLEHETAEASFVTTFLGELAGSGSRNAALRKTLQAYYSAGQNAASAAAMLGANERTVRRHLRAIEETLGDHLDERHAELEVALRMVQARPAAPSQSGR